MKNITVDLIELLKAMSLVCTISETIRLYITDDRSLGSWFIAIVLYITYLLTCSIKIAPSQETQKENAPSVVP